MSEQGRRMRAFARRGKHADSRFEANHATVKSKLRRRDEDGRKAERSYMGFLEIAGENAQHGATTGAAGGRGGNAA